MQPEFHGTQQRESFPPLRDRRGDPDNAKAIQEVDAMLASYRLDADAEREAIRAEIVGLQGRLDQMQRRG